MTFPETQTLLTRKLVVARRRGREARDCLLEIRFDPTSRSTGDRSAFAEYRITPLDDWRKVYGEDPIQALELTIRMAKIEAEGWGADWPDDFED